MESLLKFLFFLALLFISGTALPSSHLEDIDNASEDDANHDQVHHEVTFDISNIGRKKFVPNDDGMHGRVFHVFAGGRHSNKGNKVVPQQEQEQEQEEDQNTQQENNLRVAQAGQNAQHEDVDGAQAGDQAAKPVEEQVLGRPKPDFETNYTGVWKIHSTDAGVSAMQMQLLPNNKMIMFDATSLGASNIQLKPAGNCRPVPDKPDQFDCWAHAVEYDIETGAVRTLKLLTDSWCSSGGLAIDGSLVNTGGFLDGGNAVRIINACENCDWKENARGLSVPRWYATQEKLEDGSFILFGGRREFNYELVQSSLNFPIQKIDFPFLQQTTDPFENNLYPFSFLLPDGTVYLLANSRSIILEPKTGRIIRNLPDLPGGSRNYPASGMGALLPLHLTPTGQFSPPEVLVCGGAKAESMGQAEKGILLPALQDCGRLKVLDQNPKWEIEMMPTRRVMGDMLILPTTDILILNGAMDGCSGWNFAEKPNLTPLIYNPTKNVGLRFKSLKPTQIPRMYHAASAVLPDGKILVAGSNTNPRYFLQKSPTVKYPTELRVEKFSPPYLAHNLNKHRPTIVEANSENKLGYGSRFKVEIQLADHDAGVTKEDIKVTMLAPPFTTHGYSQNQRMLVLDAVEFQNGEITVVAPPSGKIAPPGYYLLYVVHRGVPSKGMWVQIV